jgi:tetratricopeptide (TPR) repeat protein
MTASTCLEQPDARTLNRQAITRLGQGDVAGALAGFQAATRCRPDFAEAWNNSGMVLHLLGRFAEAVADFSRALTVRPTYTEALTNRGRAYQALGNRAAALADFDRALACATGRFAASVLHNRGALRQDSGDLGGALADFDRALAIDPEHAATHVNRASARKEAGDLAGALADLDEALARLPHQAAAICHKRGGVRVLQNDFTGAVADYDRALALEQENFIYYLSRGNARYHLRQARGLADFRLAFRLDPEATAREIVRMVAEDVRRDAERVLDNCAKHLRISDRDVLAHVRRGLTLVLLGREDEAVADFSYAREHVPDMTGCLVRLIHLAQQARIDQTLDLGSLASVGG